MPTPFVHGLLPTACVGVTYRALPRLTRGEWLKLILVCAVLGSAPDLDLVPAVFFPSLWHHVHRYLGHNIFALCVQIGLGQWLLRAFVSPKFSRAQAWCLAAGLVLSHIFLDAMSDGSLEGKPNGAGVPLFWPLTQWELVAPFHPFPGVRFDRTLHPLVALATSGDYWRRVAFVELGYSVFFFFLWSALWGSSRLLLKALLPPKPAPATTTETSYPFQQS